MPRIEIKDEIFERESVSFEIAVPGVTDLTGGVPTVIAHRRASPSATPVEASAVLTSAADRLVTATFGSDDLVEGVWFLDGRLALPSGAAPVFARAEFRVLGTPV